jgi:hypothetical protein
MLIGRFRSLLAFLLDRRWQRAANGGKQHFMAKRPRKSETDSTDREGREIVRVAFRLHGPELQQVREVREMLSLNSELDAARYLMQRGLEAMTPVLTSRRSQAKMAQSVDVEKIVQAMGDPNSDFVKMMRTIADEKKG